MSAGIITAPTRTNAPWCRRSPDEKAVGLESRLDDQRHGMRGTVDDLALRRRRELSTPLRLMPEVAFAVDGPPPE